MRALAADARDLRPIDLLESQHITAQSFTSLWPTGGPVILLVEAANRRLRRPHAACSGLWNNVTRAHRIRSALLSPGRGALRRAR
jgi:hypothetical protein